MTTEGTVSIFWWCADVLTSLPDLRSRRCLYRRGVLISYQPSRSMHLIVLFCVVLYLSQFGKYIWQIPSRGEDDSNSSAEHFATDVIYMACCNDYLLVF